MAGTPEKQDANFVGLFLARNDPATGNLPNNAVFYEREPNSFTDFGAEYAKVTRTPFNASRQRKKGTNADRDISGGLNEDFTFGNMFDVLEGFFFANVQRKGIEAVTNVAASDDSFTVASSAEFAVGDLIVGAGFRSGANNALHRVSAVAANKVTTTSALANEAPAVGSAARIELVGFQFAAGDITLQVANGRAYLVSAAVDMRNFGIIAGEWIAVGGDTAATRFATLPAFYARISEVTEDGFYLDKTTVAANVQDGAGKTMQVFFGPRLRNEPNPDDIVQHTFTVERTLGKDADGRQSEVLHKFAFNEMTWNSPLSNKVNIDMGGVGLGYEKRPGTAGPLKEANGAIVKKALAEDPINTSRNVFRIRLARVDPDTLNPTPMFARCTEWTLGVVNNVSAAKSQGTYGGFAFNVGLFEMTLNVTAYFNTIEGTTSIDDDDDMTFDAIYTKDNQAFILDVPLIGVGGGQLTIEQNAAIMLPLTGDGAESPFGHTLLASWLPYAPSALMSTGA